MNPNMVPARPVMGQPIFIPGFNEAFAVPPPAGPVFYPQPVSSPGVPYNISRPFQSSPSYQYQPQLQLPPCKFRSGSPLHTGYRSPEFNTSPVSQQRRNSLVVVSNQGSPKSEVRPSPPLSPHLHIAYQHRQTSPHGMATTPVQRTTSSPHGIAAPYEQRTTSSPHGMTTPSVQLTTSPHDMTTPPVQLTTSSVHGMTTPPLQQTTTSSVQLAPSLSNGFLAAYKDDQSFFTFGRLEESNKVQTAEEIFKAKASQYGINITTSSDKIKETTAKVFRKVESEKSLQNTEKTVEFDENARNFLSKASHCGIKEEKPSTKENVLHVPGEVAHVEHGSGDNAISAASKNYNRSLPKLNPVCEASRTVPNVKDDNSYGIEKSQLLHTLEVKKNSKYEQMLSAFRKTTYNQDSYDDLSTPELQSPRDADAPENFDDWNAESQNLNINNIGPDSMWHSEDKYEKPDLDLDREPESLDKKEMKVKELANSLVRDAITAALQDIKREFYTQQANEKNHRLSMSRSLYTWMTKNKKEIFDQKHYLESLETQSLHADSDNETYSSERRHSLPTLLDTNGLPESQENKWSSVEDVNDELVTKELNPYSPEFKPSGLKYASKINETSKLKPDVPEFIPKYVSKTQSLEQQGTCQLEQHQALDGFRTHIWTGQHGSTQTETADGIDAATNTRQKKTSDKVVETFSCDVRDIFINTVESMFDKTSGYYVSDHSGEVDHGHLNVGIQTEENQNSLQQKLIATQKELLRARCYACRQKLEQEKQSIRSSKYQMYSVFAHPEDRSKVNEVVENRVLSIKGEVQRLERRLLQYEELLDKGQLFDKVPDFGLTCDIDSFLASQVTVASTETQTDTENVEDKSLLINVADQIKKLVRLSRDSASQGGNMIDILSKIFTLLEVVADNIEYKRDIETIEKTSKMIATGKSSVCSYNVSVEEKSRKEKPLNISQNANTDSNPEQPSTMVVCEENTQTESLLKQVLVERDVNYNVEEVLVQGGLNDEKENPDTKSKSSKTKKSKKKKKNKCEQEKENAQETKNLPEENGASLKQEPAALLGLSVDDKCKKSTDTINQADKEISDTVDKRDLNKAENEISCTMNSSAVKKAAEETATPGENSIMNKEDNSGTVTAASLSVGNTQPLEHVECSLEDIDDDDLPIIADTSKKNLTKIQDDYSTPAETTNSNHVTKCNESHVDSAGIQPQCGAIQSDIQNAPLLQTRAALESSERDLKCAKDEVPCINGSESVLGSALGSEAENNTKVHVPNDSQGQIETAQCDSNSLKPSSSVFQQPIVNDDQGSQSSGVPVLNNMDGTGNSAVTPDGQNVDGALYEAVVNQLVQVYPNLVHNPVMLNLVAAQQTQVLQMYLHQAGSTNQVQGQDESSNQMQGAALASQMQALGLGNKSDSQGIPQSEEDDAASILTSGKSQESYTDNSRSATMPSNGRSQDDNDAEIKCSKPSDIKTHEQNLHSVKSVSSNKNSSSLESMMDKYLCSDTHQEETKPGSDESGIDKYLSSPDKSVNIKSYKSLSSSIIDNNTLYKPRPPGFGSINDYSLDGTDSVVSSDSSTIVPSVSSTSVDSQERPDFKTESKQPELTCPPKPLTIPAQLKQGASSLIKPPSISTQLKPIDDSTQPKPAQKIPALMDMNLTQPKKSAEASIPNQPDIPSVSNTNKTLTSNACPQTRQTSDQHIPNVWDKGASERKPPLKVPLTTETETSGGLSGSFLPADGDNQRQQKYDGLPNIPPRLQKKRKSMEGVSTKEPSVKEPSWDDEVDDYPEPFVLKYDPRKPIESHVNKSSVDSLEDIPLPVKKKKSGEEKVEEDEWCQVTKKKKKETKVTEVKLPETRKRHQSAGHAPAESRDKKTVGHAPADKKNNFERLVGMLMEVHTGLNRSQVIDVIAEIRTSRGGLSGLTVKEIMEVARTVVIRKYEHKMINNQRPLDTKATSLMSERRRAELQEVMLGTRQVASADVETLQDRVLKMRARSAMIAQQARASMTKTKSLDDEEDICVICHDELSYGETKVLDCKHEFHTECICKWVYERERTCPTCRGHALFEDDFPKLGS